MPLPLAFVANDFAIVFLSILMEGMPLLLLGSLLSGLVDVFVSSEKLARWVPKNPAAGIAVCGLLGMVLPMCECGSVIVIRRFIRKGLPLSYAVTYMLAAPIVSPLVVVSTLAAFQSNSPWEMTLLRVLIGYLIAVGFGFVVTRLRAESILQPGILPSAAPKLRKGFTMAAAEPLEVPSGTVDFADVARGTSVFRKLLLASQSAVADFLDVAFFFIIGATLAALFKTAVPTHLIEPFAVRPLASICILMVLAVALALCSTTDAFVAANLPKAFSLAARLGFLVYGPMVDLKLFWLYGLIFKRRFVGLLCLALFIVVAFVCWRIGPFMGSVAGAP